MPFTRLALAAGCALAFAGPAFAQSAGYDAVFGGASSGRGGGGYSEVFGSSGGHSSVKSTYVSPLFSEPTEVRRRSFVGGSDSSAQSRPTSAFGRQKASGVDQPYDFIDSFGDTLHTAGSTDLMSGLGVVAGYNGGAADVDATRGGMGYGGGRGVRAYMDSLGARDVNDSFIDSQTGQWTPLQADRQAKFRARVFGQTDQSGGLSPDGTTSYLGVSNGSASSAGYSGAPGGGAGSLGYDMVFGAAAGQTQAHDYVDPLTTSSTSGAVGSGAAYGTYGGAAYGTYGGAAGGGSAGPGYSGNATAGYGAAYGSLGATDYRDPLMPGGAYGGSATATRTTGVTGTSAGVTGTTSAFGASGVSSSGAASGSTDLLRTYGAAGLTDPLRGYLRK